METISNPLKPDQYFQDVCLKKQIVLHHTASGDNAKNVIHGWNFNPVKVGTAFVIDGEGVVFKAFDPEHWAWHLGLNMDSNTILNKQSIGIEITNWGQLLLKDGKYWNYVGKEVPESEVIKLPKFRGFEYYQKYNAKQLQSLKELIESLCKQFGIPKHYNADMWDTSIDALSGKSGIYTHVSYRKDKNDMSPQPELIAMLNQLK